MRKHYLDNIRWITVVLVLVYHVFYMFNSVGVAGALGGFSTTQYQDTVLYIVYPWFMALLFLIAGMSSRYSLENKSHKQFIKDRTLKLLVPSTLGLFVFQWITGLVSLNISNGWQYIPSALKYPVMVVSGIGPLWFIQMLWLFSLLLVLIRKIDKNDRFYNLCKKCNTPVILALFVLIWGASQILNAPVITVYRFGIYFVAFLLGYFVFSHEEVMDKVQKIHIPMLILAILCAIGYTYYFFPQNYTDDHCLKHIFTSIYLWVAILAILGCGMTWLNKTSKFATYMTKASFGIYIVHYVIVLSACYLLKTYTEFPVFLIYIIATISVLVFSPVLYELIRHIPILRYFVLGIKKAKNKTVKKQIAEKTCN